MGKVSSRLPRSKTRDLGNRARRKERVARRDLGNRASPVDRAHMKRPLESNLRPPHTSRFFVGRQKIFTCRLVCGEFRQVCDKIGACQAISDSAKSQNVLSDLVG